MYFECRSCGEEGIHEIEPVEDGSWQAETIDLRLTCTSCEHAFTTAAIPE